MSRTPKTLLLALLVTASTFNAGSAWACDSAEQLRLSDEIQGLAQKNAWPGVERKYGDILKTKCDIASSIQLIAADSALNLGKTFERWERLAAANAVESTPEVAEAMAGIEAAYGRVHVRGDPRRRAPLLRDTMPFAPDQRKSIEWAQTVVEGTGSFKGMLPVGEYKVADKTFTVTAGAEDFMVVQIGKASKNPDAATREPRDGDQPLINWIGPVAMVGAGFFGSAAPGSPIIKTKATDDELITGPSAKGAIGVVCPNIDNTNTTDPDRVRSSEPGAEACLPTIRQPGSVGMFQTPNIDITLGGEIGLTYRKPEMGVVATVGYRRMFGNSLNQITVFGGWMVRPGDFRFTLGPTWGVVVGGGTGYADWVDEGQGSEYRDTRQKTAQYVGYGMGGGLAGSAGWALLDFGSLQGIVDLHGHWMRDNHRNYQGFGLRLGIVPKVKRFEE